MKANAISPALARRIANADCISFEFPMPDEHEGTYVAPTYRISYEVREFTEGGRPVYDVEILEVDVESAVAWIGDSGAEVRCGGHFDTSAIAMFQNWYGYYSEAGRCWPNRELVDAKIIQHYLKHQD